MDPKLPVGAAGTLAGDVLQEEVEVSPELRARILRQIDRVMAEGRRPVAAGELVVKPRKKGILYPILINAVAAVVVILGFLGLAYVFRGGQGAASLSSAGFQSAEGRLLEVFRRQSESRLQEEQAQTLEAQERLAATQGSLDQRLRQREEALRQTMDAELKAERERLNARGLAVAEVETRLRALEVERQAALAAEVGQLRAGIRLQEMADARNEERLVGDRIRAALAADPALGARLQAAEADLAGLRAQLKQAQSDIADRDRQLLGLQRDLGSRAASSDAEASRLGTQLAAATARAESSAQAVRAAEDSAARLGREEAFKQVIAFLDYMKADPARKQQLTAQLAARARQDPLYATVAREIQILAAGAGLGGSASPFHLLGTVSSVASGRVVVEPLVDLAVKAGARVQIRRASGLASEVLVARGIVQQAGAGGITVLLDPSGKAVPEVMDVVYVEAGD